LVLAKRYHNQKEIKKEVLCIGNGQSITAQHYSTEDFLENDMETRDLMALYQLMHAPKKSAWDQYLCKHFPLSINKVREVIAVSYIRDYQFSLAIRWLSHIENREMRYLPCNPFADLLIDNQDSTFSFDKGNSFSKIAFLKEMDRLTQKEKQHKATAADLYRLGLGYYNMTYYGRAWQLVSYERSGADGYYIPKNALPYQREYYGCFNAEQYFEKAMKAYHDRNAQARCLFMMAKCVQKRNPRQPDYFYGYDPNSKGFHDFKYSKYFPRLVQEYGKTLFFREAFNTCSYLRDFVRRN
jgi:hypothetical protein